MSTVFFTSDLHIGHQLVVNERAARAGVVLPAVYRTQAETDKIMNDWHSRALASNWDKTVSDEDTVIVVGDIAASSAAKLREALRWVGARRGKKKRLLAGNHDRVHGSHRDAFKHYAQFMEVFESVESFARMRVEGTEIMVSHFPYDGDHSEKDRYTQYRLRDEGIPIIHGHTHSTDKVSLSANGTRQVHIGVDAWNLTPVSLSEVMALAVT